jgi:hypothetical protein
MSGQAMRTRSTAGSVVVDELVVDDVVVLLDDELVALVLVDEDSVVAVVLVVVLLVLVVPDPTVTVHGTAGPEAIGAPRVSVSVTTSTPRSVDAPGGPTASNVTRATSATPVGAVRLAMLNAERSVRPLANEPGFVTGGSSNPGAVPPPMDAMVTTAGS